MSLQDVHARIASERFLDMMAGGAISRGSTPESVAIVAIDHADVFMKAYRAYGSDRTKVPAESMSTKGCRACHGSGGKVKQPCKVCNGSGRVPA